MVRPARTCHASLVLLFSDHYHACYIPRRMETRHHANPDDLCWIRFYTSFDCHFRVGAVLKTMSENVSLKNHQFQVYKGCILVSRIENVNFGFRKGAIRDCLRVDFDI